MLTLERAKELNVAKVPSPQLVVHAIEVMVTMGAMAKYFEKMESIGRP